MTTTHRAHPPVVSRDEWEERRQTFLKQEKALTTVKDNVAAARRRMPMTPIDTDFVLRGEDGDVTLFDLFAGRTQLILQHFMFHPDWDAGCPGCSLMADNLDGSQPHFGSRDVNYVLVSRAPLDKLIAYRERMGWSIPWYSSFGTDFNEHFGATVSDQETSVTSMFLRVDEQIFLTYQVTGRGSDPFIATLNLLDHTPYGRQEQWEDSPEGWPQPDGASAWWRRHDEYPNT